VIAFSYFIAHGKESVPRARKKLSLRIESGGNEAVFLKRGAREKLPNRHARKAGGLGYCHAWR
jgi:hypothetical protein